MRINALAAPCFLFHGQGEKQCDNNKPQSSSSPHRTPAEISERFYSHGLPFPQSRLAQAFPQMIGQREQWLDYNGSFVATDPNELPVGGQRLEACLRDKQVQLIFLADMGHEGAQQRKVFRAALEQINDTGYTNASACVTIDSLAKLKNVNKIVIGGGDWAYPHGPSDDTASERKRLFETVFEQAGQLAAQAPFFAVLGNHEYGDDSGPADPHQFMSQATSYGLTVPGRYYHVALTAADWAVDLIAVDSSVLAADPNQLKWIHDTITESRELEAHTKTPRWRILISHHPIQSYGYHGNETDYLQTLLAEPLRDVDLLLAGHEHDVQYIQGKPKLKPPTLICGTASGGRSVSCGPDSKFNSSTPSFATLNISPDMLNVTVCEAEYQQPVTVRLLDSIAKGKK
jgi:predicted MPP superfamily phosphohydrolase